MSRESRMMTGVIFISLPSIMYGGYFLLGVLSGAYPELELNEFQRSMFRAGHAHAGVLVILSIIVQLLVDHSSLNPLGKWWVRIAFPTAALLISGGFFFSAIGDGIQEPNAWIYVLYAGIILLALSMILLGLGLIRKPKFSPKS